MAKTCDVVVVLTTGRQDRGTRATLALGWACTALAMGKTVALFCTMDGSVWGAANATQGVQVDGFEPLHAYLEQFLALDGRLLVCAPCSTYYCGVGALGEKTNLHPSAELAGLATVVGLVGGQSQVVTF